MATFLEIPQYSTTEQSGLVSANRLFFHHHDSIFDEIDNPSGYWRGSGKYTFPNESPVNDIFIDEYNQYKNNCLFELNCNEIDGNTIRDSSGSGNKGILIGDFKVKKEDKNISIRRDSVMQTPDSGTENGAI